MPIQSRAGFLIYLAYFKFRTARKDKYKVGIFYFFFSLRRKLNVEVLCLEYFRQRVHRQIPGIIHISFFRMKYQWRTFNRLVVRQVIILSRAPCIGLVTTWTLKRKLELQATAQINQDQPTNNRKFNLMVLITRLFIQGHVYGK